MARIPEPIGVFELPFGHLLIGDDEHLNPLRAGLLEGRLPTSWPPELRGHELALAGDRAGALAAFSVTDDPVSRYNRYVLEPEGADVDALRAEFGVLVDLVEFTIGRADTPPPVPEGDLRALVLAAHAAVAHPGDAVTLLDEALAAAPTTHPALIGVLHGALGEARHRAGDDAGAIEAYTAGIAVLTGTDLELACAEQHFALAAVHHERAAARPDHLQRAVHHYHCVVQLVDPDRAPELFAAAHANLAAAYLTMPMVEAGDQLRLGVAVGSLRAALTVFSPETHPRQWASAQLNLANALVYAPSTHQGDNLVEAVELYEAVLVARDRDSDPLGRARVLANQGNALAHLGLFDHAWGKLVEARFIFEEFEEYDAVTSVRGLLDEITRQRTTEVMS